MKRTCNNCKALDTLSGAMCLLGYKIETAKEFDGIPLSWKPLEECEKPLTISDFIYVSNIKRKQRQTHSDKFKQGRDNDRKNQEYATERRL